MWIGSYLKTGPDVYAKTATIPDLSWKETMNSPKRFAKIT